MGSVRVHEFMTLDGVIDTPTWAFDLGFDPRMGGAISRVMGGCDGILLGRTTYEMFEPAWSQRTAEDDPGAPFMNDSPKYVVSSTLRSPTWAHSEAIGRYDAATIRGLKERVRGALYVSGSGTLVRAMLGDGLVDELHLFIYPLTVGAGPRLFGPDATPASRWTLAASERYDNGVLYVAYTAAAGAAG